MEAPAALHVLHPAISTVSFACATQVSRANYVDGRSIQHMLVMPILACVLPEASSCVSLRQHARVIWVLMSALLRLHSLKAQNSSRFS
jgi:hypothetical protein